MAAWVVDTCIVLDVLDGDPVFGAASAECLTEKVRDGLVLCPVSAVELSPAFLGSWKRLQDFLQAVGIDHDGSWMAMDTQSAYRAWFQHIEKKRTQEDKKRPVADVLIGAFALRHAGLITRNTQDFKALFPSLTLIDPIPK